MFAPVQHRLYMDLTGDLDLAAKQQSSATFAVTRQ